MKRVNNSKTELTSTTVGYESQRWQYDAPHAGNANFGWVQHIALHPTFTRALTHFVDECVAT